LIGKPQNEKKGRKTMQGKRPESIQTDRLCLRAITDSDESAMLSALTCAEISKTYMIPPFSSPQEAKPLFERLKTLSASQDRFVYGIYWEEKLIGWVNEVEDTGEAMELGFVITPAYQRKGFATETLRACMQALFDAGYLTVKTGAFEENLASIRVMEKCGMVRMSETENIEYRGNTHRCILFQKSKQ
jgi:RimJ/RimL family protein N-acetyltransferase